jgi:hypothetical protein
MIPALGARGNSGLSTHVPSDSAAFTGRASTKLKRWRTLLKLIVITMTAVTTVARKCGNLGVCDYRRLDHFHFELHESDSKPRRGR